MVAGGDGTVAAVVKMLPDRSVPLAIIPSGTANNIARSLGICGAPEASIADGIMSGGGGRRGDVHGAWGCRRFVEGVGFGAFAHSLRAVDACEEGEGCPTGREALRTALREAAPLPLAIEIEQSAAAGRRADAGGHEHPDDRAAAAARPRGAAGDGMLHISWLPARRRDAMIGWLGEEKGDPPLELCRGREIRLTGGEAAMRIDDEACWLEAGSEVIVRLEGEPVLVLAPTHAPALAG